MNLTVEEACESYYRFLSQKKKPQSLRTITSRFDNYVIPFFANCKVSDIDVDSYLKWQEWINQMGFSYKYKKALHYSVVAMFSYLERFYGLDNNVAKKVGDFANNEIISHKFNVWDKKEFHKFMRVVDNTEYKLLFRLLFKTGLRIGEALALTWNDVDLKNRTIQVNKTTSIIHNKRVINPPKTKKSIRIIRIDRRMSRAIDKHKKYYIKNYENFNPDLFVFGGNKPLSTTTIERKKNQWCKKANVCQIRIHDFRHSHATYLISHNVPITIVSERLGHSDISMTLNTYSHVLKRDEKRVLRTLFFL